ncbi:hypothetical protein J6590_034791 [Homalodisca vitripennis]|nr:hypothetical protein J6590_034791 [Homalodisca vitripennis]
MFDIEAWTLMPKQVQLRGLAWPSLSVMATAEENVHLEETKLDLVKDVEHSISRADDSDIGAQATKNRKESHKKAHMPVRSFAASKHGARLARHCSGLRSPPALRIPPIYLL